MNKENNVDDNRHELDYVKKISDVNEETVNKSKWFQYLGIQCVHFVKETVEKDRIESTSKSKSSRRYSTFKLTQ